MTVEDNDFDTDDPRFRRPCWDYQGHTLVTCSITDTNCIAIESCETGETLTTICDREQWREQKYEIRPISVEAIEDPIETLVDLLFENTARRPETHTEIYYLLEVLDFEINDAYADLDSNT